jgi:O-succinylbenzoate synthase
MDERVKLDAIRVRELTLPLLEPFQVSTGALRARRSWIVEIESGGAIGYGESAPNEEPFYSDETLGTVRTLYVELFLPRLVGREFASIDDFDAELRRGVRGNPFARAGLENAYWDLCCTRSGTPLADALAERLRGLGVPEEYCRPAARVESGVAVGIPEDGSPRTLARTIARHLEEGYRRVKIKIRPGWDVEACRAARAAAGDGFPLWTDANASFDIRRDFDALRAMDGFGLLFHEQPLDHRDLVDHSELANSIATPICLDESLESLRAAEAAFELESSRIWNIKVQRLGGICEATRIYRFAVEVGADLWGGTMPESGIGSQPILALAAFPGFVYPTDVEPSRRWFEPGRDPVEIEMARDGTIAVPRAAGIAALLDAERYARHTRPVPGLGF